MTEPSAVSVPSLRTTPSGMSLMKTVRFSLGSIDIADRSSAMTPSSLPTTSLATTIGVSATGSTLTVTVLVLTAVSPASVEVAVIVRLREPLKLAGGVMVISASSAGVTETVPSGFSVPPLRVTPAGMSLMTTDEMVSSVSVTLTDAFKAIVVSSSPETFGALSAGASATGASVTVRVSDVTARSPLSAEVAEIVRSSDPLKFLGGVKVSPDNSSGVRVIDPSGFSIPALSETPSGISLMVIARFSSGSVNDAEISRKTVSSSFAAISLTTRFGASATG